ncbi:MAG: ribosome biogenesis GTPase YlqF [Clostridiales bacterium]|nr:ribosome biogenesis GTPase YlqF [Clostridiales bacterium]
MNIQWYPGHMTKAKRAMQEDIRLVDLIIELVDARVPLASRNPDIDALGKGKARLIILNKTDLADPDCNERWAEYFRGLGCHVVSANSRSGAGLRQVNGVVQEACREKIERDRRRGILNRPVRAMVVGIPNVGKSTFINSFAGKACAKTGNKPGVTKGNQWIRLSKTLELLDTPGILWPKFEDSLVGLRLAFIGSINDDILERSELAVELLAFLRVHYPGAMTERYGLADEDMSGSEAEILECIARVRGCLTRGGGVDSDKAAGILLDDFRAGRLGRITLEEPPVKAEPSTAEDQL